MNNHLVNDFMNKDFEYLLISNNNLKNLKIENKKKYTEN